MDPNAALKNARAALRDYLAEDADGEAQEEAAALLADAFEALDGWLSKGGFLPDGWTVSRKP